MTVVADDARHLPTGEHLTFIASDGVGQRRGNLVTAAYNPVGALIIEIHDEGMGGEGCLVTLSSIERQVAHQHLSQEWVCDHLIDHLIDRAEHQVGLEVCHCVCILQRTWTGYLCHLLHTVTIAL